MEYEWDEEKSHINWRKHKIDFAEIEWFDWATALITDRSRSSDKESRFAAVGYMNGKLYTVIYTWRGNCQRIISLRRSNKNEEKAYEKN
ncbi:MAG: BrnT family toxin [Alphaproteobacteria bacterium]|nr:BrnT family toxin [Alphaproteobacteria bacterium]